MEKILLNGDIYINITEYNFLEWNEDIPEELSFFKRLDERQQLFLALQLLENIGVEKFWENLDKQVQEKKCIRIPNYEVTKGFYHLFISNEGLFMLKGEEKMIYDEENTQGEFVNLREFLDSGMKIEKYLIPSKLDLPIYIVLYEYKDFWIVQEKESGEFTVGNKKAFMQDGYKLGKKIEEFYQKEEVYQAIVKQELNKGLENIR